MASVEPRGASYRVVWRPGGRGARKRFATFPTAAMAESARQVVEARGGDITPAELYTAYGATATVQAAMPTVAEFAAVWLVEQRQVGGVQPDTVDARQRIVDRRILPQLGHLPIGAITPEMVRGWVGWMTGRRSRNGGRIDAETVRKAHGVLHLLLGAAVPKWLPVNPAARRPGQSRVAGLPKPTVHEPIFLTPHELELIRAACTPRLRDMVDVSVRTGLRLGELLPLRVEDVQLTGRRLIRVRRGLKNDGTVKDTKSRRSRRDVSISTPVAAVLSRLVDGKRGHELIFTTVSGRMWSRHNLRAQQWLPALGRAQRCPEHPPPEPAKPKRGVRRKWRPDEISACDCPTRLHRRPRWHDLRHTHVSLCVEAGWDITRVSRRLGHESVRTTIDIYGSLWDIDPDDRLDAVDKLLDD